MRFPLGTIRKILAVAGILAATLALLWWLAGGLAPKIEDRVPPARLPAAEPAGRPVPLDARLAEVRRVRIPLVETAPGTVEAVHSIQVASRLLSTVLEIPVRAGQRVRKGDLLARLDDRDIRARLEQAEAALKAGQARLAKARPDFERAQKLYAEDVITKDEFERAKTELETAEAEVRRAQRAVEEARVVLGWTVITSPVDGIVVDKRVEAGDTVRPGQVLVELFDPSEMQLVADVRESLARTLRPGDSVEVEIDALEGKRCRGTIREIVPTADPRSRTFQVKVTGPCPPGVLAGMYGRLVVPIGERDAVVVPAAAVRRVGQLDLVDVVEDGRLVTRAVRLGRRLGDDVEVLSGLRPGEKVLLHDAT